MAGLGIAVVSTSKGVMTDRAARRWSWWRNYLLRSLIGGKMSRVAKAPVVVPAGVDVKSTVRLLRSKVKRRADSYSQRCC